MLLHNLEQIEFFEGTEKLLEVWFKVPDNDNSRSGLRKIPREEFEKLVTYCNAEVVGTSTNDHIDSYVLSESSLFVANDHIVLKTCGKTKVLNCLEPLIELAKKHLKLDEILNMFYSRRVYLRPDLQEEDYQTFDQEVQLLQDFFPSGTLHTFGKKGEEWYLYTTDNYSEHPDEPDVTLEILMSELDRDKMELFTKTHPDKDDKKVTMESGIADIIPGSIHEGVLFDPCGYSMNGLRGKSYSTIHVTPQPHCSYVSYETNIQLENYDKLVAKVLETFKPGKFIVTVIANERCLCGPASSAVENISPKGYKREDYEEAELRNYSVAYGHFRKC